MNLTPRKRCRLCGKKKPATAAHFELHKQCRGGITSRCKPCSNARAKAWREENREALAKRWKERYAPGHKAAARKLDQHYRKHQPQVSRSATLRNAIRWRIKTGRATGDLDYMTRERILAMLLATPRCPVCAVLLSYPGPYGSGSSQWGSPSSASIDRIIPNLGYVRGNVAIICWRCNALKRDALLPELEKLVRWLRKVTCKK